jgi:signal transduction histidine kinase/FixJ family two-component response regulator
MSEKIVLVDDEKRMCDSLSALLKKEGYDVETYQNSVEASEVIQNSRLDLLITDIKMPDLSGLDLLRVVKKVDNDIPVILMTGYASLDSAMEAISKGAYDYLMKPVEFTQLLLVVKRALEKRSSDLARLSLLEELKISNLILHRRINELNALYEAGKSIGSTANLKDLLKQIVVLASNVTDAQVGSIMLLDEQSKILTVEAAIGLEDKVVESTRLSIGESIAGYVAQNGEPLIIDDVENDKRFKRINKERYGAASLLCAPLMIKNKVIGIINMANKQTGDVFTKDDLRLLSTFASQAAVAVDDANQFEKKKRRLIEFEILLEIANEVPQLQTFSEFSKTLVSKLNRVFPIDFSIWFNFDNDSKMLIADNVTGMEHIPVTDSGRIDRQLISSDKISIGPINFDEINFDNTTELTNISIEKLKESKFIDGKDHAYVAIPVIKFGEPSYVFFLGSSFQSHYSNDDIALAKLVISQSAVLFEKEKTILNATRLMTMGNMISEISHDLRRPLTTIKGGLQVIRGKLPEEVGQNEIFSAVDDEVGRMNELVRELVDFSNPKKYQTEKVDLRTIITKASDLIAPDFKKKNISYSFEFQDVDWNVIVNKNQILEVFINLFVNAFDAMDDNDSITIQGLIEQPPHKKVNYLAIKVIDTGSGIKKENLSRIHERYFTTKETGIGLGLAVVERIISAHNGTLKVESVEGEGTTFTIYFPLNELRTA